MCYTRVLYSSDQKRTTTFHRHKIKPRYKIVWTKWETFTQQHIVHFDFPRVTNSPHAMAEHPQSTSIDTLNSDTSSIIPTATCIVFLLCTFGVKSIGPQGPWSHILLGWVTSRQRWLSNLLHQITIKCEWFERGGTWFKAVAMSHLMGLGLDIH